MCTIVRAIGSGIFLPFGAHSPPDSGAGAFAPGLGNARSEMELRRSSTGARLDTPELDWMELPRTPFRRSHREIPSARTWTDPGWSFRAGTAATIPRPATDARGMPPVEVVSMVVSGLALLSPLDTNGPHNKHQNNGPKRSRDAIWRACHRRAAGPSGSPPQIPWSPRLQQI